MSLNDQKLKEMYDKAFAKWGFASQVAMLAEEASELSVAALHLNRNARDKATALINLAEEIADCEIMIAEFRYYLKNRVVGGGTFGETLEALKKYKLSRLATILESE